MLCWKDELRNNIRTIERLKDYVTLSEDEERALRKIVKRYPMNITRYYASLIKKDDVNDPIKRMSVPSIEELEQKGFLDTSGEKQNTRLVGLQHKYPPTALVLATHYCATFCRYCFRRRMVGASKKEVMKNINDVLSYLEKHKEIDNILISGGDPLTLDDDVLEEMLLAFSSLRSLALIRIGTRIPVVFPQRVTESRLAKIFKKTVNCGKQLHIVTHFNHPREITKESRLCVRQILRCGVPVHNQSVLLKGVNDSLETLSNLFNKLVAIGVDPYYLFQCRPVKSALHFQVPLARGVRIVREARKNMSGLAKRFKFVCPTRKEK